MVNWIVGGGGGGGVSRVEGQLCLVLLLWKLNFKLLELITYSNFRPDLDHLKVASAYSERSER